MMSTSSRTDLGLTSPSVGTGTRRRSRRPSELAHWWLVSRLVVRSPLRDPSFRDIRDSEAALSITLADACAPAGQVDGNTPQTPLSVTIPVS